ncbi:LytTR family DNA-binding domain-containing protein [soil metagenome]
MIKAITIDDEEHCLKSLSMQLADFCPVVTLVASCNTAEKGLQAIKKFEPDLVFLDIEMPVMNGFELLEQFSEINFAIIFTTSYDQYAIKAFKFSALDYLLKPVDPDELQVAVQKVIENRHLPMAEQFQILLKQVNGKQHTGFNKLAVPTAEGFELIKIDQLLYLEANDNYTHLHLNSKRKIVACRSLRQMEEQLYDFAYFLRVHNSFVVNLNEVNKYVRGEGGYLVMSDGANIHVSRTRKDALLKFL